MTNCPSSLCSRIKCKVHSNFTCSINPCGTCTAGFYDKTGKPVDCARGLMVSFNIRPLLGLCYVQFCLCASILVLLQISATVSFPFKSPLPFAPSHSPRFYQRHSANSFSKVIHWQHLYVQDYCISRAIVSFCRRSIASCVSLRGSPSIA